MRFMNYEVEENPSGTTIYISDENDSTFTVDIGLTLTKLQALRVAAEVAKIVEKLELKAG